MDGQNKNFHDGNCSYGVYLDNTQSTTRWDDRFFAFIIGLIKINAFLEMRFFSKPDVTFINFRKRLAYGLIFYGIDETD